MKCEDCLHAEKLMAPCDVDVYGGEVGEAETGYIYCRWSLPYHYVLPRAWVDAEKVMEQDEEHNCLRHAVMAR